MNFKCRNCGSDKLNKILDLGKSPLANDYIVKNKIYTSQKFYDLKVCICKNCFLIQSVHNINKKIIFPKNYSYFSSFSKSWLIECEKFAKLIIDKYSLNKNSLILEIASNDGYLLNFFKKKKIKCIGVEPTSSTAKIAKKNGLKIIEDFFSYKLSKNIKSNYLADVVIANNVLAHVPNILDFVKGVENILKKNGIAVFEFHYAYNLVKKKQFDIVYHEHFSYFTFNFIYNLLKKNNLQVFDVDQISSQGGSLRIYAKKEHSKENLISKNVKKLLEFEKKISINSVKFYSALQPYASKIKKNLLKFIKSAKKNNKIIAAYGAAAKGNTLLNYCKINNKDISYVVDANINKQGKFLPGSKIPIVSINELKKKRPDYILVLPWNISSEIVKLLKPFNKRHSSKITFFKAVPKIKILN